MPDRWVSVSSVFGNPSPWEDDLASPPSPSPAELLADFPEPEGRHGAGQHHHDGAERVVRVRVHGTGEVNVIAAGDRFIAPSGSSPSDDGSDSAGVGGTAAAGGGSPQQNSTPPSKESRKGTPSSPAAAWVGLGLGIG